MERRSRLLAAYDEQVKGNDAGSPPDVTITVDGPVRFVDFEDRGFIDAGDLAALTPDQLDALIARAVAHFDLLGRPVEWKTHGHDRSDLVDRLRSAGFVPEDEETVLIADTADIAVQPEIPDGVTVRATTAEDDLFRIAAMEAIVWDEPERQLTSSLLHDIREQPDLIEVFVAEAAGEVVSAGWIRYQDGTDFAGMWGGATLREWRGRGIYRSLVAIRANRAEARRFRYLQVDASVNSRPILERLGFVAVTTTTPYVHTP